MNSWIRAFSIPRSAVGTPPPTLSPAPALSLALSPSFAGTLTRLAAFAALTLGLLFSAAGAAPAEPRHDVLVVVGAPGTPEFAPGFIRAAERWREACAAADAACTVIGPTTTTATPATPSADSTLDRNAITAWFSDLDPTSPRPVWFVYLGHGTWDGREARLNLRGADLMGTELKLLLTRLASRPAVIIHGGSASGPLVPLLAAPSRVVVTATSTGDEVNYARFGERLAEVIGAPAGEGDLDMDGQVSVLEAFVAAARGVELFYAGEGRLSTEHALIEDNGDGRGTPAAFFQGARLARRASDNSEPDGTRARRISLLESAVERALSDEQRAQRDLLERELETLRARRAAMAETDYLHELERILRQIGEIYRATGAES